MTPFRDNDCLNGRLKACFPSGRLSTAQLQKAPVICATASVRHHARKEGI